MGEVGGVSDLLGWLGEPSRFIFDAVPVGIVVQGVDGVAIEANRAAEELLGLTLDQMRDMRGNARGWRAYRRDGSVIDWADHASMRALATNEPQRGYEMGVDGPGGRRWLHVESVPFAGVDGGLAGTITSFVDVTDRVASDDRLRLTLEATETGTWDWDVVSDAIVWSSTTERIHGVAPGGFAGSFHEYTALIHPDDRAYVRDAIRDALDGDVDTYQLDFRIVRPDGSTRWVAANGRVLRDAAGLAVRMLGTAQDVTERKETELEREASQRRLAFLAQATSVLAQSLDYETTLSRLAHLAVPFLADWCGVDIVADHSIRRVAVAYADPDQADAARRLSSPPDPAWHVGIPSVIRTGRPQVFPTLDLSTLGELANDTSRLDLYREVGIHSLIVMPLVARGRTLGAIWFARAETPHEYGPVEVDLAQELARRASLAVDNARLFRERDHIADALQRTLLPPELPTIPGVEISAQYATAAGEDRAVGGDFYDVYATDADTWHVVIGDVCGKGPEAAALTGLARHTLRAAAMQEKAPSAILAVLNEVILRSVADERFCTAAYACVEPGGDDGGVRMTLACGGHPLPFVLRSSGDVETVGRPGMLIGALPEPDLADVEVELAPGDAVVMCTDGVSEATGKRGFFGVERLRDLVAMCAGLDADGVATTLRREVLAFQDGAPRDDVAIVVLRVSPDPPGV